MRWRIRKSSRSPTAMRRWRPTPSCVDRRGKRFGIVIGRLEDGKRFLAHTPDDDATLDWMMREEILGKRGTVTPGGVDQSVQIYVGKNSPQS